MSAAIPSGGPSGGGPSAIPISIPTGSGISAAIPSGGPSGGGPSAIPGDHDQNAIDVLLGLVDGAVSRKLASRALRLHRGNVNAAAIYLLDKSQQADSIDSESDSDDSNDQIAKFLKIVAASYAKTKKK
jgi:hypothetical protein